MDISLTFSKSNGNIHRELWICLLPYKWNKQKKKNVLNLYYLQLKITKIVCVVATQTWFQGLCTLRYWEWFIHVSIWLPGCYQSLLCGCLPQSLFWDITHWMKVHWDFSFICGVRKKIQGQLLGKVIPLFSSHKISDIIHVYSPNGKT